MKRNSNGETKCASSWKEQKISNNSARRSLILKGRCDKEVTRGDFVISLQRKINEKEKNEKEE